MGPSIILWQAKLTQMVGQVSKKISMKRMQIYQCHSTLESLEQIILTIYLQINLILRVQKQADAPKQVTVVAEKQNNPLGQVQLKREKKKPKVLVKHLKVGGH
jgi:hypothetical protein